MNAVAEPDASPPGVVERKELLASRREVLEAEARVARSREKRFFLAALGLFLGGLVAVPAAFDGLLPLGGWTTAALFLVAFVAAVAVRVRATNRRRDREGLVAWMDQRLARLDDEWSFGQDDGHRHLDPDHPYAADLDVFGEASLYWRCNACHSVLGRDTLARYLQGDVPGDDREARQEAVRELIEAEEFREALEAALRDVRYRTGGDEKRLQRLESGLRALLTWGDTETPPPEAPVIVARDFALGAAAVFSVVMVSLGYWSWVTIVPFYLLNWWMLGRATDLDALEEQFEEVRVTLDALGRVVECVETAPLGAPLLREIQAELHAEDGSASKAIATLRTRADRLSQRDNEFWKLTLDVLLVFDLHARRSLLAWKRLHGAHLGRWLRSAAAVEAFAALASYAEAVPGHAWPEEPPSGRMLEAEDLAHPLLPRDHRVGNDVAFDRLGEVLLVTGSNMSGKSTFLRSVGLAIAMARIGLPVCARSLAVADLDVVTCMRVQDSLSRGSSRFHAEVTRLKFCVDAVTHGRPVAILLDEILGGTNSTERHHGALAVLASVAQGPTLTLVSTHDLGLTQIADQIPDRTRVVHFRDLVEDGAMAFDYVMRPGTLPSTNALRVMRAAGLDVPDP